MAYWDRIKSRGEVDDRRGVPGFGLSGLGGAGLFGVATLIVIQLLMGGNVDLNTVLQQLQTAPTTTQTADFEGRDSYEAFASAVLGSANDTWRSIFKSSDKAYQEPRLVLFRQATQSECGFASSEVGPHYCPNDETIYLDETFFKELTKRFGAQGGDVAEAYVIAHEVGHHVQHILGLLSQHNTSRNNEVSIKLELQADCFAGIWAYSVKDLGVFEPGEINEAIDAAEAVGDDRIQQATQGSVTPESWTHGSSEQRKFWLGEGLKSGDPARCNTF